MKIIADEYIAEQIALSKAMADRIAQIVLEARDPNTAMTALTLVMCTVVNAAGASHESAIKSYAQALQITQIDEDNLPSTH